MSAPAVATAAWPAGPADGHALAVLERRRALDLTVLELSLRADVESDVVTRIERGDSVDPGEATAVALALGMDPSRHVPGTASRHATVAPIDALHAADMAHLARVAGDGPGLLVMPDAAAMPTVRAVDPVDREAVRSTVEAAGRAHGRTMLAGMIGFMASAASLPFASAYVTSVAGGPSHLDTLPFATMTWFLLPVFGFVFSALTFLVEMLFGNLRAPTARRRLAALDGQAAAHRTLDDLRRRASRSACSVSPSGLVVHEVDGRRANRVEVPAWSMRSVTVADVSDDHVTVTVRDASEQVVMPWLPRTRDLLDVVASWQAPADGAREARP